MPSPHVGVPLHAIAVGCAVDGSRRSTVDSVCSDAEALRLRAAARLQALRQNDARPRPQNSAVEGLNGSDVTSDVSSSANVEPHSCAWDHVQTESGRPCFLTVEYVSGDDPMSEIQKLEGGSGKNVSVAAISPEGKCHQMGVRNGYILQAMSGHPGFTHLPAWRVRLLLQAPVTLTFSVGPIDCSAIPTHLAGVGVAPSKSIQSLEIPTDKIESRADVWVVAEEVVFKPHLAYDELEWTPERNFTHASCWEPSADSTSGFAGNDRSAIRWLAPGLQHFFAITCVQDNKHVSPISKRRGSQQPPNVGGDLDVLDY
eukprot:TRINITY_DN76412_c0_g1_i1.p1 TRINITY_DN76412_c0_g1~~TRINITY_DN76412_c0_g1_i1.p1  ORF type:complete len:314 (-),score=25.05 TRINITY_DN76412_c0_g1_i1:493-1434(-)